MAAATAAETATLVRRLRGKGLTDDQVVESLQGLGHSKASATAAVGGPSAAPAAAGGSSGATPAAAAPATQPSEDETADQASDDGGGESSSSSRSLPGFELPSPTLKPPRKLDGGDLAGFFTGLLLFALGLNFIKYGPSGVTGWFKAKFLNQPMDEVTADLIKRGSTPQAPTVSGGDALEQLLTTPLGPIAPSASTGLTSTKVTTPTNV